MELGRKLDDLKRSPASSVVGSGSESESAASEAKPLALLSQAAGVLERASKLSADGSSPQSSAVATLLAEATASARKSLLDAKPPATRGQELDKKIEHKRGTLATAKESVQEAQDKVDEALAALSKAKEAAAATQLELDGLWEARAAVEARAKEVPRVVCQQLHGLFGLEMPFGTIALDKHAIPSSATAPKQRRADSARALAAV